MTVRRFAAMAMASVLALGGGQAAASARKDLTLSEITFAVQQYGSPTVVRWLVDTGQWERVLGRAAGGRGDWIALVASLDPGGAAHPGEEISVALASALPHNPRAVLAIMDAKGGSRLGPASICNPPFFDGDGPAFDEASGGGPGAYRRRALAALRRVADPKLAPARQACIVELQRPIVPD